MIILKELIEKITDGDVPDNLADEIKGCILGRRFEFIKKGDIVIGFFTWHYKDDKILINNMCILPIFRNRNNLLFLRKYLRSKLYNYNKFYWENRKKQKEVAWDF